MKYLLLLVLGCLAFTTYGQTSSPTTTDVPCVCNSYYPNNYTEYTNGVATGCTNSCNAYSCSSDVCTCSSEGICDLGKALATMAVGIIVAIVIGSLCACGLLCLCIWCICAGGIACCAAAGSGGGGGGGQTQMATSGV